MTVTESEERPTRNAFKPAAGAVVAKRYKIERMLGRGGMGSVWAGWDQDLERLVAVKFMAPEFAERASLRDRFTHEAKAAARLRTRHVTQVFDFGVDGTTPFIVMEFLEGEDLRTCLRRTKRLPLSEVARIVRHICKALTRASEAGIVHRDLKPGNVFLAQDDGEDVVKVLDFGVAKTTRSGASSDATKSGVVLGSPPYLSPEQARGGDIDCRSDLWSVAAVAYRSLTGRAPYRGRTDADTIVKICTEKAAPPSKYVTGLPPTVDAFFAKAFTLEPSGRYQTPAAFADAFAGATGVARGVLTSLPDAASSDPAPFTPAPFTPAPFTPAPFTPAPISGEAISLISESESQELTVEGHVADEPTVRNADSTVPSGPVDTAPSTVAGMASDSVVDEARPLPAATPKWPLAAIAVIAVVAIGLFVGSRGGPSETTAGPASQTEPKTDAADTGAASEKARPSAVAPPASVSATAAPSSDVAVPPKASASVAAPRPVPATVPKAPTGPAVPPARPKPKRWGY